MSTPRLRVTWPDGREEYHPLPPPHPKDWTGGPSGIRTIRIGDATPEAEMVTVTLDDVIVIVHGPVWPTLALVGRIGRPRGSIKTDARRVRIPVYLSPNEVLELDARRGPDVGRSDWLVRAAGLRTEDT